MVTIKSGHCFRTLLVTNSRDGSALEPVMNHGDAQLVGETHVPSQDLAGLGKI